MRRPFTCVVSLASLCLLAHQPARAVFDKPLPLKEILADPRLAFVFVAKVEKLDPDKPALILQVDDQLKGQTPFDRLPIKMEGDSEGQKAKHPEALFKRLAVGQPAVVFCSKKGKTYLTFGYTNGTWFQLIGYLGDEPSKVAWLFTHCEPYLRRTFKGPTAELVEVVKDGLAGKKEPPPVDLKEPAGLGPELPSNKGARRTGGPVFAVIPTFVIMGPLALLATLFPAVFGGLALFMRRWLVFLSAACMISTLFALQLWFGSYLEGNWWGSSAGLWTAVTLVALGGALVSAFRYHAQLRAGNTDFARSSKMERFLVALLTLLGLTWVFSLLISGQSSALLVTPWKELLLFVVGISAGGLYLAYRRLTAQAGTPGLPVELLVLWGMVFAGTNLLALQTAGPPTSGTFTAAAPSGHKTAHSREVVWTFQPEGPGRIDSSPLVTADRVYIGTTQGIGLSKGGAMYCLDRDNGQIVWKFDDEDDLKQLYSTPCLADGRLYFGEGLHEHRSCRFYCLDAATGKKLWQFETSSHTESSPAVADGKVFFGAGDDGVYGLDAATGQKLWQFQPGIHVDADPLVVGDRLYCGSGVSQTHKDTRIFCLNTSDGQPRWQVPMPLPVWGSPSSRGGLLYFGLGNGRLNASAEKDPAGAVLCVEAETGRRIWQYDVPDAVLMQPTVDAFQVYVGSRDGSAYALDRHDGRLRWKQPVGSPVVKSLAEVRCFCCDATTGLLAIGSGGQVVLLDPVEGKPQWTFNVGSDPSWKPEMYSAPAVIVRRDGETDRRRYFFGASLNSALVGATGRVYCLEDEY